MKRVIISGGFDPLHVGHTRLIHAARQLGNKLIVILNNDKWLHAKKGFSFMQVRDRKEILLALEDVDEVIATKHTFRDKDTSVCKAIKRIAWKYPNDKLIFANGGDRKTNNVPEVDVCKDYEIELAWNVGGTKIRSSQDLVKHANIKKERQK